MKWVEEIEQRLEVLPVTQNPEKYSLETCCPDGLEGTGIMDDFGHRIADAVLAPYVDFFVESPTDIAKLIAAVRVANKALREIGFHDCDGDGMPTDEAFADIKGIASKAETQLQSGEFGEEDES